MEYKITKKIPYFGWGSAELFFIRHWLGEYSLGLWCDFAEKNYQEKKHEFYNCDFVTFDNPTIGIVENSEHGAKKVFVILFGEKFSLDYEITKDTIIYADYIAVLGESELGRKYCPYIEIDGEKYALTTYSENGRYVGDYVSLTGGSSPYSIGEEIEGDFVEIDFYVETFNAGGGRVTAGINGRYKIPLGAQQVKKCKNNK